MTRICTICGEARDVKSRRDACMMCRKGGRTRLLRNREWLVEHYETREMTTYAIASLLGCSQGSVRNWLTRHDIDKRGPSDAAKLRRTTNSVLLGRNRQMVGRVFRRSMGSGTLYVPNVS